MKIFGGCRVKNILAKAQTAVLERCGASNALLVFDFDGTLAPAGKDARAVQLRPTTRRTLANLAARYPTAVISSRPRADVLARLGGIPLQAVIGNHGLEPSAEAQRYHMLVRDWMPKLREALSALPGVSLDNKLYSVTIQYREAKNPRTALSAIRRAVSRLGKHAVTLEMDGAVDVLPAGAAPRGAAVSALCKTLGIESAIYIGRDAADEHAFNREALDANVLAIRVGRAGRSKAAYYVAAQSDIDRLLKSLLLARPANDTVPTRRLRSKAR